MTPDQAVNIINIFQLGLLVKLFLSVLAIFYGVFLVVVYRQVVLMTQVLDTRISPLVRAVAMGQVVTAGVLVLLAVLLG